MPNTNSITKAISKPLYLTCILAGFILAITIALVPQLTNNDRIGSRGGALKAPWAFPTPNNWPDRPIPNISTTNPTTDAHSIVHWRTGPLSTRKEYQLTYRQNTQGLAIRYTTLSSGYPFKACQTSAGWENPESTGWVQTNIPKRFTGINIQASTPPPGMLGKNLPLDWKLLPLAFNTAFYALIFITIHLAIRKLRQEIRSQDNKCTTCGYPLKNLPTKTCPECGNTSPLPND